MNVNVNKFVNWCELNRLTVNTKKSKRMLFSNRHDTKYRNHIKDLRIELEEDLLEVVPNYKYLGLQVDDTLTFVPHVK